MNTTDTTTLAADWPTRIEQAANDIQTARFSLRREDRNAARGALAHCQNNLPGGSRAHDLAQQLLNELRLGIRPTFQQTALLREYIEDAYDAAVAAQD